MDSLTPFRVEWTLGAPIVVPAMPMHLDDLLAWASVDEMQRQGDPDALTAKDDLPLEKFFTATDWVWRGSRLEMEPASEMMMIPWIRRTDLNQMAKDQGRVYAARLDVVNLGSGSLKAFANCFQAQWVKHIVAYGVGDIERVRDLLSRVSHLGKWRRNGWGKVASCRVIEDTAGSTNWANRVVPLDAPAGLLAGVDFVSVTHPLRPPYWDRGSAVVSKEPLLLSI